MHVKLSDFVPSGHTVDWEGVTYKVPEADADVLIEKISLEVDGAQSLAALASVPRVAEEEGWAEDPDKIKAAISERTTEIQNVTNRMIDLAARLLKQANPEMGEVKLPASAAMAVVRLALNETEEVTAQQIAAKAIGLEQAEDPGEGVADPPTKPKTASKRRSGRSRSRTPSLTR